MLINVFSFIQDFTHILKPVLLEYISNNQHILKKTEKNQWLTCYRGNFLRVRPLTVQQQTDKRKQEQWLNVHLQGTVT